LNAIDRVNSTVTTITRKTQNILILSLGSICFKLLNRHFFFQIEFLKRHLEIFFKINSIKSGQKSDFLVKTTLPILKK